MTGEVIKKSQCHRDPGLPRPSLRAMAEGQQMINNESNILMLDVLTHMEFGKFHIIPEATSVAHRYHVKAFENAATGPLIRLPNNRMISFAIHGGI